MSFMAIDIVIITIPGKHRVKNKTKNSLQKKKNTQNSLKKQNKEKVVSIW